jgi:hypothetical protein
MEPDRTDMVFLGVTVIAVIAFGVYIMFGPWWGDDRSLTHRWRVTWMVSSRQDLLREVVSLIGRARMADDPQQAADLIKQAADRLETVAELLAQGDPEERVH